MYENSLTLNNNPFFYVALYDNTSLYNLLQLHDYYLS